MIKHRPLPDTQIKEHEYAMLSKYQIAASACNIMTYEKPAGEGGTRKF